MDIDAAHAEGNVMREKLTSRDPTLQGVGMSPLPPQTSVVLAPVAV
jgi:hypothetical protein